MLFKEPTLYTKKQMPKNQMLKKCKHDLSSNQHTEKVMKYKKKTKEKSEYVTVPKQFNWKRMNFKTECFSSLIVTMNTEVITFNIGLSVITKPNHEIQERWHLAPMLVYYSIHRYIQRYRPATNWIFRLCFFCGSTVCHWWRFCLQELAPSLWFETSHNQDLKKGFYPY